MEITGKSNRDVDRVVRMDDLSVRTLIGLIERLEQTSEMEQFIFREAEMDDAYRQADADVRLALREQAPPDAIAGLSRIRELIFASHDFVGLGKTADAIGGLNTVVNIKIGLEAN